MRTPTRTRIAFFSILRHSPLLSLNILARSYASATLCPSCRSTIELWVADRQVAPGEDLDDASPGIGGEGARTAALAAHVAHVDPLIFHVVVVAHLAVSLTNGNRPATLFCVSPHRAGHSERVEMVSSGGSAAADRLRCQMAVVDQGGCGREVWKR